MKNEIPHRKREDTYALDPESTAEMIRLMRQDRLITRGMGGLFPELDNQLPGHFERIVDMGCGPGNWVLNVAYEYPDVQAVGVDISELMVKYAQNQAEVEGRKNATFIVYNLLKPLPFPDNYFDMVNARFMVAFIYRDQWQNVLAEFYRVLRPGGILRLTEPDDMGVTNSPALEELCFYTFKSLAAMGYGFSRSGRTLCMTPMLGKFLKELGCRDVRYRPCAFDFSAGTELRDSQYENWRNAFVSLRPLLEKNGLDPDRYEHLYETMQQQMLADEFRGLWYMFTAWGRKPLESEQAAAQTSEAEAIEEDVVPVLDEMLELS